MLGRARAVVDRDQVDEFVAVEVDRLELVVVLELREQLRGVAELPGPVVVSPLVPGSVPPVLVPGSVFEPVPVAVSSPVVASVAVAVAVVVAVSPVSEPL